MDFYFIIQCSEFPFLSCRYDFPYRKWTDFFMLALIHSENLLFYCILADMATQYLGLSWKYCDIATIPYLEILSIFIAVIL